MRAIPSGTGDVKRLTWSPDGTVLVAGYDSPGAIRAFSGRSASNQELTQGPVYGLAVGRAGLVAATDHGGSVLLLRAKSGLIHGIGAIAVRRAEPITVSIAPDETRLLVGYAQPMVEPELIAVASCGWWPDCFRRERAKAVSARPRGRRTA